MWFFYSPAYLIHYIGTEAHQNSDYPRRKWRTKYSRELAWGKAGSQKASQSTHCYLSWNLLPIQTQGQGSWDISSFFFFFHGVYPLWEFPSGSVVNNLPVMQEMQVQSLYWEDPLEEGVATLFSVLTWRIPWTGALQSLVTKSRIWLKWLSMHACIRPLFFSFSPLLCPLSFLHFPFFPFLVKWIIDFGMRQCSQFIHFNDF